MSRTLDKTKAAAAAKAAVETSSRTADAPKEKPRETARDTVEQLVVAFILAVLIKGFVAEAFVIPTGSMAPTLYGQHKEVTCPYCKEVFGVNAADESEDRGAATIDGATCLNCRAPIRGLSKNPSFKGDRILVMKFLYSLPRWLGGQKPSRWSVVVFHFPEDPETNYIKRLVGLPGEFLKIYFGDLLSRPLDDSAPFQILRKPLAHQQAMQQLVWDDSHRPALFEKHPEWKRWTPEGDAVNEGPAGSFRVEGTKKVGWNGLKYRHLVPDPAQWAAMIDDSPIRPGPPRASLITDYYAYQTGVDRIHATDSGRWFKPNWVGDLTVSGKVKVAPAASGTLRLELVEAGRRNTCEIDLKSGEATVAHDGKFLGSPAATPLKDDGREHEVAFANVDDRLTLWIDGQTPFGEGLTYDDGADAPRAPTEDDLTPVRIAVRGCDVTVSGLVLKRDIYYTQAPGDSDYEQAYEHSKLTSEERELLSWPADNLDDRVSRMLDLMSDPRRFPVLGKLTSREHAIQPGRYMMMGDNSPQSSDARAWGQTDAFGGYSKMRRKYVEKWAEAPDRASHEVPESLLIGEAFFVYWPHGVPFWPDIRITRDFRVPFRPYVERMKWIR